MRNEKLEMIKGMRSVFLTSSHSFFLWYVVGHGGRSKLSHFYE